MTRHEARAALKALDRVSNSGYEVAVMLHQLSPLPGDYCWSAARYPLDPNDPAPTEFLADFHGRNTWQDALAWALEYTRANPDDGALFSW